MIFNNLLVLDGVKVYKNGEYDLSVIIINNFDN